MSYKIQEYDVETLEFRNTPTKKKLKVGFTLANMIEITASYGLIQINKQKTSFTYTCISCPLKTFLKLFLFFESDKVVIQFCERVKKVAKEEFEHTNIALK